MSAATFTSKVERLKYQVLTNKIQPATLDSIHDDVGRLPDFVYEKSTCKLAMDLCLSPALESASPGELSGVIDALASHMRYRREQPSAFRQLDLQDIIIDRGYITLSEGGERIYVQEYRERVERRITEAVETHPAIKAIREGREISDDELIALERALREQLSVEDVQLTTDNIRKAYGLKLGSFLAFARHILDIDALPDYEAIVKRRFEEFIAGHPYTEDQIRFLRAVQSVFLRKRRITVADLYDEPALQGFGANAVERFFTDQDIKEILSLTDKLAA